MLFAQAVKPESRALPDEKTRELQALVVRRPQLLGIVLAERQRLAKAPAVVRRDIRAHVAWLIKRLKDIDQQLGAGFALAPCGVSESSCSNRLRVSAACCCRPCARACRSLAG